MWSDDASCACLGTDRLFINCSERFSALPTTLTAVRSKRSNLGFTWTERSLYHADAPCLTILCKRRPVKLKCDLLINTKRPESTCQIQPSGRKREETTFAAQQSWRLVGLQVAAARGEGPDLSFQFIWNFKTMIVTTMRSQTSGNDWAE